MSKGHIPHFNTVVGFCVAAIAGYAIFSFWVVFYSEDAGLKGDVIGTWKSFAVAGFMFWIGSSSGGKAKDESPAGTPNDPLAVQGAPAGSKPVTVQEKK